MTLNPRRRKLIGIVLAVLVFGAGLGAALYSRRAPAPPVSPATTEPLVSIERPVLKHSEGDKLAWQIRLKQIQITGGQGEISAEGIQEALIYGASGAPLVRVTAQKVVGTTGGSDFQVTGKVTVVSYQGVVFSTDTVQWNQAGGKLVCPGSVHARSKDALFSTTGLTYDLNASRISAPNQVNLYSGQNKILGRGLDYNVNNGDFSLNAVQMIFNAEEAREILRRPGLP
jgi:hypothetical protein